MGSFRGAEARTGAAGEAWEGKVADRILHNLSLLLDQKFQTVQELSRYRKEIARDGQSSQEVSVA